MAITCGILRDSRGDAVSCLCDNPKLMPCAQARVPPLSCMQVEGNEVHKNPPYPLSTLALQKEGTKPSVLRLPGERIMKLAEELYQAGFISYPRTETDSFDPGMDLMVCTSCLPHHASFQLVP
jgi:DNA topoisomerase IA